MENTNMWDAIVDGFETESEAQFSVDSNGCPDELLGFRCIVTEDKEFELIFKKKELCFRYDEFGFQVPDVVERLFEASDINHMLYWTTTEGVSEDETTVADRKRSAGGWSDVEPEWIPSFYSAAKPQRQWLKMERRVHVIVGYAEKCRGNITKLEAAKKRFWQRYFEAKKAGFFWLRPRDIQAIKGRFETLIKEAKSSK